MKEFTPFGESLEKLKERIAHLDTLLDSDPDATCPYCDGYGHIIDETGARPCICVQREVVRTGIEYARIPKRFEQATLDNFEFAGPLRQALSFARKYVEEYSLERTKGLYIHGSTGVGKTHLAIGILKTLIARGFDGVFYNIVGLLDEIRSTYDPNNPNSPKSRLERDMLRQVFVLDDFGVQKTSAWVADRLYALINRRYQDCKTLIITSNIELKDLGIKVDSRLYSRMTEMLDSVEIKSGDFRSRLHHKSRKEKLENL